MYLMLVPMLLVFLFWRYFPIYELLGCFKVSDAVKPVSEQFFSGFSYFKRLLRTPEELIAAGVASVLAVLPVLRELCRKTEDETADGGCPASEPEL